MARDQQVQVLSSSTGGNVPTDDAEITDLAEGELAVNTADEILFIGNGTGDGLQTKITADTLSEILSEGNSAGTNSIDMNSNKITSLANGTNAQDAVTKQQLDNVSSGVSFKDPVEAATDGTNVDLASATDPNPIDGVTLQDGERVLLKDQTDGVENGVYIANTAADPTTWTRSADFDETSEVSGGQAVFVQSGTNNANEGYIITSVDAVLGTDPIVWGQFTGLGDIVAGTGLTKTGDTIDAVGGDGIVANADELETDVDGSSIELSATDGSGQLRIASGAAGDGISGGSGTALSVNVADIEGAGVIADGSNNIAIGSGDGITVNADEVEATVDGTTISLNNTDGSGAIQIATGAAGNGLTGGGGAALAVNAGDASINVAADSLNVQLDASGDVETSGTAAGNALVTTAGEGLNVAVDNDSITHDTNNALQVNSVDGGSF